MKKAFELYNKTAFIVTMLSILIIGFIIKNSEDINIWYRLLNLEAVLLSIWVLSALEIISKIYFKKNLRDYINFIALLISIFLIFYFKDYLSQQPKLIELKYIGIKFGILGAVFYILPFLSYGYNKNINSIIKIITLFSALVILSNFLTDRYKISTAGFIITALFLISLFVITNKEKNKEED